jgi:ribosomal protein S18 acetylase RimI-like enzyme
MQIRSATHADLSAMQALAVEAGMFTEDEVGFFAEQFANQPPGAAWSVAVDGDEVVGATYVAPEPFADRMWNLYFLVVDPARHGGGLGRRLVEAVEEALRALGPDAARTLVVETSSTDAYAGTRRFYARLGYDEEARIRQFYGPDDDKVVFWKSLVG